MFRLFEQLDKALVELEKREDFTSKSARIWPSEASAVLLEPKKTNIVGGCHRRTFYRLLGTKTLSQMDAVGARRVRTGKAVEDDTTFQAQTAGIHIASGVRMHVPTVDLAFEIDLIVVDPQTMQAVICENKSIYGYIATKEIIKLGMPKMEHLIQTLIYINEIRTSGHLKQVIADCVATKDTNKRNRIKVTQANLDVLADDLKTYGKICYETRDTCETREFDIGIYEDFDGLHYPTVDGKILQIFTIESIYERFETIQGYFNIVQAKAIESLLAKGTTRPVKPENIIDSEMQSEHDKEQFRIEKAFKEAEKVYWNLVGEEMRSLGPNFLPPADFQYKYADDKIENLYQQGLIGEVKYKEWKSYKNGRRRKPGIPIIGDHQCKYCPFKLTCIPIEYPELKPIIEDIIAADAEEND